MVGRNAVVRADPMLSLFHGLLPPNLAPVPSVTTSIPLSKHNVSTASNGGSKSLGPRIGNEAKRGVGGLAPKASTLQPSRETDTKIKGASAGRGDSIATTKKGGELRS